MASLIVLNKFPLKKKINVIIQHGKQLLFCSFHLSTYRSLICKYVYIRIIHFLSLCIRIVCCCFFLSHPSLHSVLTFCISRVGEEADDADLEAPKIYEPIPSLDFLAERLKSYQELYNESIRGAKMDLVFFKVSWMDYSLFFKCFII